MPTFSHRLLCGILRNTPTATGTFWSFNPRPLTPLRGSMRRVNLERVLGHLLQEFRVVNPAPSFVMSGVLGICHSALSLLGLNQN